MNNSKKKREALTMIAGPHRSSDGYYLDLEKPSGNDLKQRSKVRRKKPKAKRKTTHK